MSIQPLDLIKEGGFDSLDVLKKLFQSSGEGIMLFNDEGLIQMSNPRAQEMFGYEAEELLGEKVEMLVPSHSRKHHKQTGMPTFRNPAREGWEKGAICLA